MIVRSSTWWGHRLTRSSHCPTLGSFADQSKGTTFPNTDRVQCCLAFGILMGIELTDCYTTVGWLLVVDIRPVVRIWHLDLRGGAPSVGVFLMVHYGTIFHWKKSLLSYRICNLYMKVSISVILFFVFLKPCEVLLYDSACLLPDN